MYGPGVWVLARRIRLALKRLNAKTFAEFFDFPDGKQFFMGKGVIKLLHYHLMTKILLFFVLVQFWWPIPVHQTFKTLHQLLFPPLLISFINTKKCFPEYFSCPPSPLYIWYQLFRFQLSKLYASQFAFVSSL